MEFLPRVEILEEEFGEFESTLCFVPWTFVEFIVRVVQGIRIIENTRVFK